jgi:hypothetical protein
LAIFNFRLSAGLAIFSVLPVLLPVPARAEPIRISGQIRSPDAGQGAAGVQIELLPAWEGYAEAVRRLRETMEPRPLATAHTDQEGFYEIAVPEAGAYRLRLRAAGYMTEEIRLDPLVEDTDLEPKTLAPAEPADIRVVSADGKALPGLVLKVLDEPNDRRMPGGPRWRLAERSGVTDGNGRLALRRTRDERLKLVAVSPAFLGEGAVWKGGSQSLVFVAKPASKLEVRAGDGKPVAGALVLWRSWPIGLTGPEGQLELAVPPGDEPLRVEAGDGRAAQIPAGSKAALLLVRLEPPQVVEGQVLQQNSPQPVPNALVWAGSRLLAPPVRAGADGKFRLLVSTVEGASLEAAAPGYLRPESQLIPRATPAAQAKPAVLRLEPATRIAGQVLDTAGNPVPRAYVLIGMPGVRSLTLSRAGGRFQISGLQCQKNYKITGSHPNYSDGEEVRGQTAAPGTAAPFVKLVLKPGVTAFGHVVDGAGKPLPGVRVTLIGAQSLPFSATTDAAGRFEVKAVNSWTFTLRARTPGFSPLSRTLEIPPGTSRFDLGAIELPAAAVIEGEVTDTRGTPIAGASVEGSFKSSDPLQQAEDPASLPPKVKTSLEGRFRLTDLPRDTPVQLQVEHEGYLSLRVPGVETPLQSPLHLEMRTARGLTGRVVGPEGEPVGGATLRRLEESNEGINARGEIELGITDARGGFQISGFEPGPNDLRVKAVGYATKTVRGVMIPADRDLKGFEIVLGRGVILEVRVLSAEGKPVAGAGVDLYPVQDASDPMAMERFLPMPRGLQTDDWGTCRAELPEPGRYWVGTSTDQGSATIVVTTSAGTTPVELRFPSVFHASGRVTDAQGQPLASVSLNLASTRGTSFSQSVGSLEDGAFVFSHVPDGTYRLQAVRQGFKQSGEPLEVAVAGSDVQGLDLRLEPVAGATVSGHLLGLKPEELLWASVGGYGSEVGYLSDVDVEPDGHYEIKNVAPGAWRFTAAVTGGKRMARQQITIQPGESGVVVDFEFGKNGTLSGTILVGGSPLSGADIMIYSKGSEVFDRLAASRHDGHFEIRDLAPGSYRLVVNAALGAVHQERAVEMDGDSEMRIDIATETLAGLVVSAGTGEPIAEATVMIDGQESAGFHYSTPTLRSGEAGAFESRLSPGSYRIKVQKEGYASAEVTAEVRSGGAGAVVEIRLSPVGTP